MEKANARVSVLIVLAACLVGMALGSALTFAILTSQRAIPSTGVVLAVNVGVYSDDGCRVNLTSIDWGSVYPGDSVSRTLYVKNTGNVPVTLSMAASGWSSSVAEGQLVVSWDRESISLSVGQSVAASLTLKVSSTVHDVSVFSVNVVITGSG